SDQSVGIEISSGQLALELVQASGGAGTYALDASSAVQLIGFNNILTLSGTAHIRVNTTGAKVNAMIAAGSSSVQLQFDTGDAVEEFSGTGLDLAIGTFASVTGDFSFSRTVSTQGQVTTTKIELGAEHVNAFVGTGATGQQMGVQLSDGTLGAVLFQTVDSSSGTPQSTSDYALTASGTVQLLGFTNILSLSGTMAVRINTTGAAVNETVATPGGNVTVAFTDGTGSTLDERNIEEISGQNVSLNVANFVTVSGDFTIIEQTVTSGTITTTKLEVAVVSGKAFVGSSDQSMGVEITGTTFGMALYRSVDSSTNPATTTTTYALQGSAAVALVGFNSILTLSGTVSVAINTTGQAVNESIAVPGSPTPFQLTFADGTAIQQFSGTGLSLGIANFVSLTGDFSFTKTVSGNNTKILVGADKVNTFLGANDANGRVGLQLSNATLGLVLYQTVDTSKTPAVTSTSYALEATAAVQLLGFNNVLTLSGQVAVRVNTTGGAVHEQVAVGNNIVPIDFADSEGNLENFSGQGISLGIAGFVTLTGNFGFTEQVDNATNTTKILIGATQVNAFLGTTDQSEGVQITNGQLAAVLYRTVSNGTQTTSYALDASAGVQLVGFDNILSLSGTAAVRVNTTGAAVNETVPVPGGDLNLVFTDGSVAGQPNETNIEEFTGTGLSLSIANFVSLTGDFSFQKSGSEIKVGAANVNAFLGVDDGANGGKTGIQISDAQMGLILSQTGTPTKNVYALDASASVQLLGFSNVLNLSGTVAVRINTTGAAVSDSVTVGGTSIPVVFTDGSVAGQPNETNLEAFSGTNLSLTIANYVTITGDFSFSKTLIGNTTEIKVGADNVKAFFGLGDPSGTAANDMGVSLSNGQLALVLFRNSGTTSTLTEAPALSADGLSTTLSKTPLSGQPVTVTETVSGTSTTLTSSDYTVSGSKITFTSAQPAGATLSVAYSVAGSTTYALDASGTLALVGFDSSVLSLSGTVHVRINTTGGPVSESVTVGNTSLPLQFGLTEGNLQSVEGTSINLSIGSVVTLTGDFSFTKTVNNGVTEMQIGAAKVNAFFGVTDNGTQMGLQLSNGQFGLVLLQNKSVTETPTLSADLKSTTLSQTPLSGQPVTVTETVSGTSKTLTSSDYTVSGSTITFTNAQPTGATLSVTYSVAGSSYALSASADVQLLGFANILTLSGTIGVRANNTGGAVNQTVTVGTSSVPVNFASTEGNLTEVTGQNLTLSVAGFVNVNGNFAFSETASGNLSKILVAVTQANAFLGTSDGSMGVQISNATFGLALYRDTTGHTSTYALEGSATAQLVGFDSVLTLSGTLGVKINTTGQAVTDSITVPGSATPFTFDFSTATAVTEFSGTNIDISVGGFVDVSGNFLFTKSVSTDSTTNITTTKIEVGIDQGSAFLGTSDHSMGVEITGTTLGLVLYQTVNPANNPTTTTTYALEGSTNLSLVGFSNILTLSGTLGVEINNTGLAVNESIPLPDGTNFSLSFANANNIELFSGSNITLGIPGFLTLNGSFAFGKSVSGSVTTVLVGASGISAYLGTGDGKGANDMGLQISNATLGLVFYPCVNGGSSTYALDASAGVSLVGFSSVLSLSGTMGVRINTTGGPVNQTIPVGNTNVTVNFGPDEGHVESFSGSNLSLGLDNNFLVLTGNFAVSLTSDTGPSGEPRSIFLFGASGVTGTVTGISQAVQVSNGTLGLAIFRNTQTNTTEGYALTASVLGAIGTGGSFGATGTVSIQRNTMTSAVNESIVVGTSGTALTSPDGSTWTSATSGAVTLNGLSGIAYGAGQFVAVSVSGATLTSPDGVTWTSHDAVTGNGLAAVTYADGQFVAVGANGTILTSTDGVTWTSRAAPVSTPNLNGITYGNSEFVAVGDGGTILTSPDGVTWTSQTSGVTGNLAGVAYGGTNFVAVGASGVLLSSNNGVAWTKQTSGVTVDLVSIVYGGTTFVTVGANGTILSSTDGASWTSQTSGVTTNLLGVAYSGSAFVAVGAGGTIVSSADGKTWTPAITGTVNDLSGITFGNAKFVVLGNATLDIAFSSPDQIAKLNGATLTPYESIGVDNAAINIDNIVVITGSLNSSTTASGVSTQTGTNVTIKLMAPDPNNASQTDTLLSISADSITYTSYPVGNATYPNGLDDVAVTNASLNIAGYVTISGSLDIQRPKQATGGGSITTTVQCNSVTLALILNAQQIFSFGGTFAFSFGGPNGFTLTQPFVPTDFSILSESAEPGVSSEEQGSRKIAPLSSIGLQSTNINLGPLQLTNPGISLDGLSLGFDKATSKPRITIGISLHVDSATFTTEVGTASITPYGTGANAQYGVVGTFKIDAFLNLSNFTPSQVNLAGFTLTAGQFQVTVGTYLTFTADNLDLNPLAGPNDPLLTVGSASAKLSFNGINIHGSAQNFAVMGNGHLVAEANFGVSLGLGQGQDSSALGWPTWLPLQDLTIGLRWKDFNSDPSNFIIDLSAQVGTIPGLTGLSFSGGVQDIQIDPSLLAAGQFPIIGIGAIDVGVSGNLAGGTVSGSLIGGIMKFDANNNVISNTDTTTPVASRVFFAGIEGGIDIDGMGLTMRLGLSAFGPLSFYIDAGVPIILEPTTGIAITDLRGGVDFGSSVADPFTQNYNGNTRSAEAAAFYLRTLAQETNPSSETATQWLAQLESQVATLQKNGAQQNGFSSLEGPIVFHAGATLYDAYASTDAFRADVDLAFDTTGKILVTGVATFGGELSINAYFYGNLSDLRNGSGQFLFLLDEPGGALRAAGGMSVWGYLGFNFVDSNGNPITAQTLQNGYIGTQTDTPLLQPAGTVATLTQTPVSGQPLTVTVNGATVANSNYQVLGNTMVFTSPQPAGAAVSVTYTANSGGTNSSVTDNPVLNGPGTTVVLTQTPLNGQPVTVTVNGNAVNNTQPDSATNPTFVRNGTTITFNTPQTGTPTISISYKVAQTITPAAGFQITIAGGVREDLASNTLFLDVQGQITLTFTATSFTVDLTAGLYVSFLSQDPLTAPPSTSPPPGAVGEAAGQLVVNNNNGTIEVWGALAITTGDALKSLQQYGIFLSGSASFQLNTTGSAKTVTLVDSDHPNGQSVTLKPYDFSLFINAAGSFQQAGIVLFYASATLSIDINANGLQMFFQGTIDLGPPQARLLEFQANGLLVINASGLAAELNLTINDNISVPGMSINGHFTLVMNTTGQDVTYTIPDVTPAIPTMLGFDGNSIETVVNGQRTITVPGAAPAFGGLAAGSPGFYVLIEGSGSIGLGIPTQPPLISLTGAFGIEITTTGFSLEFVMQLNLDPLGSLNASGSLTITSAGLFGTLDVTLGGAGTSTFSFSGKLALEINTTATTQSVSIFTVDTTTGAVNGTQTITLPKQSFDLFIGGQLNIANLITISGSFELKIDPTQLVIQIDASLTIFGSTISVQGFAAIYGGSDPGLALDLVLSVPNGIGFSGVFTLTGTFELKLNTTNETRTATFADGSSLNVPAHFFQIAVTNADLHILVFDLTGSLTITIDSSGFRIDIPQSNPLTFSLFNVVTVQAYGFISSDGTFDITASAGITFGDPSVFGFSASMAVRLFHDSTGTTGLEIQLHGQGTFLIFGFSIDADAIFTTGEVAFDVQACISIWFFGWHSICGSAHFSFGYLSSAPPPDVATLDQTGRLTLNLGPQANQRNVAPDKIDETFVVENVSTANGAVIRVIGMGATQDFPANQVTSIFADAGTGNDSIQIDAGVNVPVTIYGGPGNDQIIDHGSGNATLFGDGQTGDTGLVQRSTDGFDYIQGGTGVNTIYAGGGNDVIYGGPQNDTITVGDGNDQIHAQNGNNSITVGAGSNTISVGNGNNTITVSAGGATGGEVITAGNGNNTITLGAGNSQVTTGNGNNAITLGAGNSQVTLGSGNNVVHVAAGNETINTGSGANQYLFAANFGQDSITATGGSSTLDFSSTSSDLAAQVTANTTTVTAGYDGANLSTTGQLNLTGDRVSSLTLGSGNDQVFVTGYDPASGSATLNLTDPNGSNELVYQPGANDSSIQLNHHQLLSGPTTVNYDDGIKRLTLLDPNVAVTTVTTPLRNFAGIASATVPASSFDLAVTTADSGGSLVDLGVTSLRIVANAVDIQTEIHAPSISLETRLTVTVNHPLDATNNGYLDLRVYGSGAGITLSANLLVSSADNADGLGAGWIRLLAPDGSVLNGSGTQILAANSHLIIKSKNGLGSAQQPIDTTVAELTAITAASGAGDIYFVETDSLVLANDDGTPTGQAGYTLANVSFAGGLFPGLAWMQTATPAWLASVVDGQQTHAVDAGNGLINLYLAANNSLLTLKSGDLTTEQGHEDITLTAGDMDFLSGANQIHGTGRLLLSATASAWTYTIGTAAQDQNTGLPVDATGVVSLSTREISALRDGFSQIIIGRQGASHDMQIGAASFLDPVTFYGQSVLVEGELNATDTTSDPNGDTVEIDASSLTVAYGDVHHPEFAPNSGITAKTIITEIQGNTTINGWLRAATNIQLQTGLAGLGGTLTVGPTGEIHQRLDNGFITLESNGDASISGLVQADGQSSRIVIQSDAGGLAQPTGNILTTNAYTAPDGKLSITLQAAKGVNLAGRVYAGMQEGLAVVLSSPVSFAITLGGSTTTVTVTPDETSADQTLNDLATAVQQAVTSAGVSGIQVQNQSGQLKFSSTSPFSITGLSNANLLALYPVATAASNGSGQYAYLTYAGYTTVGQGGNISVISGLGTQVAGFVAASDLISFNTGLDPSGTSFALDATGLLYMLGSSQTLTLNSGNAESLFGNIFVLGGASNLQATAGAGITVTSALLVNNQITMTAGADPSGTSFNLSTTGTLTTYTTGGNIAISGADRANVYGDMTAAGTSSGITLNFGNEVTLGNGAATNRLNATSQISVTGGNDTSAESILVNKTTSLLTSQSGGAIAFNGSQKVEVDGLLQTSGANSTINLQAGTEFFEQIGGQIFTLADNSSITINGTTFVGIYGDVIAGVKVINDALVFTATTLGTSQNNVTVQFVNDPTVNGDAATATYNAGTTTLVIGINTGTTDANAVVAAVTTAGNAVPLTASLSTGTGGAVKVQPGGILTAGGTASTAASTAVSLDTYQVIGASSDAIITSQHRLDVVGNVLASRNPVLTSGTDLSALNSALVFTATALGAAWDGVTIQFVNKATVTGDAATANYDSGSRTLTIGIDEGVTDANAVLTAMQSAGISVPFTSALAPGNDGTGKIQSGSVTTAGGGTTTDSTATYARNGTSLLIAGQVRSLGANSQLALSGQNDIRILGNVYVDGANSDLTIQGQNQVYIDGWVEVQDQIDISAAADETGTSVVVTQFGRVESLAPHSGSDPLQTGNTYQINISGQNRVEIDGVVEAISSGAGIRIHAGNQLLVNSAVTADGPVIVDGGADASGISVMLPTEAGLTSRGTAGGSVVSVQGVQTVMIQGHLNARGTGASVQIDAQGRVSIGGDAPNALGQIVEVGGFINATHAVELSGGADPSQLSVDIRAP
ncbi:MAG: hypothetical protein KGS61_00450, partial [Verrucomicrobia bacterium]|nr:hypothetical protein [Verrucomicrobiota bacterium]